MCHQTQDIYYNFQYTFQSDKSAYGKEIYKVLIFVCDLKVLYFRNILGKKQLIILKIKKKKWIIFKYLQI